MKVKHFMVKAEKIVKVGENATLKEAAEAMTSKKVGSVVVVTGETPVGIITAKDLVKFGFCTAGVTAETKVSEVMTKNLIFASEEAERDQVGELLLKNKIHHALIKDARGHFVGLTTTMDIVREAALDAKAFPYNRSAFLG